MKTIFAVPLIVLQIACSQHDLGMELTKRSGIAGCDGYEIKRLAAPTPDSHKFFVGGSVPCLRRVTDSANTVGGKYCEKLLRENKACFYQYKSYSVIVEPKPVGLTVLVYS